MRPRSLRFRFACLAGAGVAALAAGACNALFGIDPGSFASTGTGGGHDAGSITTGSGGSSSGSVGSGGGTTCAPSTAVCNGAVLQVCDATGHAAAPVNCPVMAACDAAARTCIDGASFGRLAVGRGRGCVIEDDRSVRCWGSNRGTLVFGDVHYTLPTAETVPKVTARQLSVGDGQQCALQNDGTVVCWGANDNGELGVPAGGTQPPVAVPNVLNAVEVGAASRCSCARIADGTVTCWGQESTGCLGIPSPTQAIHPPTKVPGVTDAVQLRVGSYETPSCARRASGNVVCWSPSVLPAEIPGVADAIDVAVGSGLVFIRTKTGLFWSTQTPDNLAWTKAAPYPVTGTIVAMAAGSSFCGLQSDGVVVSAPLYGANPPPTPAKIAGQPAGMPTEIAVGYGFTYDLAVQCLRLAAQPLSSAVYCWGDDAGGALGAGAAEDLRTATDVPGVAGAAWLTTAESSTSVVLGDGSAMFWGRSAGLDGMDRPSPHALGLGTDDAALHGDDADGLAYVVKKTGALVLLDHTMPAPGKRLLGGTFTGFTEAHAFAHWDVALAGGKVILHAAMADANSEGIFGDGTNTATLGAVQAVPAITTAQAIAFHGDDYSAAPAHVCALLGPSGSVSCWGGNHAGEVGSGAPGNNVTVNLPTAVVIPNNEAIVSIAAGQVFTCAAAATGKVYCWGDNSRGQIGVPGAPSYPTPVAVTGITTAVGVTANQSHACAWLADKTVMCWGANDSGQLGNGTFDDQPQPVAVTGLQKVVQVSAGPDHTCARRVDGSIACWGSSYNGQSGTGATGVYASPQQVLGL